MIAVADLVVEAVVLVMVDALSDDLFGLFAVAAADGDEEGVLASRVLGQGVSFS
ncbi:MAG: hypothetical protein L0K12_09255 [Brevibacterium aurantiacum]|nr:hypothetical protein [Brevibacterium aurantiacum]